jgi:hypothetical protein
MKDSRDGLKLSAGNWRARNWPEELVGLNPGVAVAEIKTGARHVI